MRLFTLLLVLTVLVGCASRWGVTKAEMELFMVECDNVTSCYDARYARRAEQLEYEHEVFLDEREEELRSLLLACDASGRKLIYDSSFMGTHTKKKMMGDKNRRAGYPYISPNANLSDFMCLSDYDATRWLKAQMSGNLY